MNQYEHALMATKRLLCAVGESGWAQSRRYRAQLNGAVLTLCRRIYLTGETSAMTPNAG